MNSPDIAELVAESARRFGDRNSQQHRQLANRLSKLDQREVAAGLLHIFTSGQPPPLGSPAQELAGLLLEELVPKGEFDLVAILREALPRYELSVEQFPHYLVKVCGVPALEEAYRQIEAENLSDIDRKALETLRFWMRQSGEGMRNEG